MNNLLLRTKEKIKKDLKKEIPGIIIRESQESERYVIFDIGHIKIRKPRKYSIYFTKKDLRNGKGIDKMFLSHVKKEVNNMIREDR